jgi:hypothetical protein
LLGVLFDPLDHAVAATLQSTAESSSPDPSGWGSLNLYSHPAEYAGSLDALVFATRLTWAGLLIGGLPLALAGLVMDRQKRQRPMQWFTRSVTALQAAFVFQLGSLMATLLCVVIFVALAWPPQTWSRSGVVFLAVLAAISIAHLAAMRSWVRLRARAGQIRSV